MNNKCGVGSARAKHGFLLEFSKYGQSRMNFEISGQEKDVKKTTAIEEAPHRASQWKVFVMRSEGVLKGDIMPYFTSFWCIESVFEHGIYST